MECNKDEALRAKTIAENKLEKKDYAGAKKFTMKAQTLYPGLDGISQMKTTIDIYISAENKISGEVDWYGVLGVNPSADDETIRKRYRQLALLLHPDKNKSVGADGAFKIISEAWSLLSDNSKRLAYDQRRGSGGFQKVPLHATGQTAQFRPNGMYNPVNRTTPMYNSASRTTSVPMPQNTGAKVPKAPTPNPSSQRSDTFWTICTRCNIHYEFVKTYLNSTLLCPNCKKGFMASETAPPFNFSNTPSQVPLQQRQVSQDHAPNRNAYDPGKNVPPAQKMVPDQACPSSVRHASYPKVPVSGTANVRSADPSIAAKAANVVQEAQKNLKRAYAESNVSGFASATASMGWEEYMKKRRLDDENSQYKMNSITTQTTSGFGTTGAPGPRVYGFSRAYRQPNSTRELTPFETHKMLMAKARKEIGSKLNMWRSERTAKAACGEVDQSKERKKQKINSSTSTERLDQNGNSDLSTKKTIDQAEKGHVSMSTDNTSKVDLGAASMTVPDPDFHDFDNDRTETSFGDNEVWAAYDDDDGMPRFYALVSKVISRKPFKLRINWLNSKTNSEFSNLDWVSSGFYKTCGEFRVGKYETCTNINSFSQKVNWSKGLHGSILVFPQKDDVWALYKNWSSDWDKHTPDDVIHKYDMVTVLDDYNEEQGISVAPLVKVAGFKTVFHPNLDPRVMKRIPNEEMFRFSHRVPCHVLTGQEAENAPKGCLELDPAATPLELLQVITEAIEDPITPNEANGDEEVLQTVPSISSEENESD